MHRTQLLTVVMAFLLLVGPARLTAQPEASALQDIRVDVVYLASDYLEGRAAGTRGEALAAEYIASRFEELGLTPRGEDGGWYQAFSFRVSANPHAPASTGIEGEGKNVVGFLDRGAERTVVIGAHYDHLGHGGSGSLQPGDSLIHNGADDNASGIAAMLEIARQLQASPARENNYLFLAFSGEEMGLFGSKHFVEAPTLPLEAINYMINLDMVGRLNAEKTLVVSGTGTSPVWDMALEGLDAADSLSANGLQITRHASGVGASDHTSFYLKDIPVLHFFTGQHREYHKPVDDSHLINFDGVYEVASLVVRLIESVDDEAELAFTETKDDDEGRQAARFKVSLGVMPDYTFDGEGLRIDGVMADRPAGKAGLEDGDIVVAIGDVEVGDIYAYMEALSRYEAGDTTTVTVKRGEETLKKQVTF